MLHRHCFTGICLLPDKKFFATGAAAGLWREGGTVTAEQIVRNATGFERIVEGLMVLMANRYILPAALEFARHAGCA